MGKGRKTVPSREDGARVETPAPDDVPASDAVAEAPAPADGANAPSETETLRDQLLRLRADFENFRKRTVRERGEIYRRANEAIMEDSLPALDHFELALKAAAEHPTDTAIVQGFRLVYEQLQAVMAKHGMAPVDAEGGVFDPTLHEAVAHLPSATFPENAVITQTRRGYRLGDYLLRPAQVVVSSGAPDGATPAGEDPAAVNEE